MQTEVDQVWQKGNIARMISSLFHLNQFTFCNAFATRLKCVIMAPFGIPVVPPVY